MAAAAYNPYFQIDFRCFHYPHPILESHYEFISFGFNGRRVALALVFHLDYFLREIGGQIAYKNPMNFFLIATALLAAIKSKTLLPKDTFRILVFNAIPLWAYITGFLLFRPTLPHWTGPEYTPLIFIATAWLREKTFSMKAEGNYIMVPKSLELAVSIIRFLAILAIYVINYLPAGLGSKKRITTFADGDFTQDKYIWCQVADGFMEIRNRDIEQGIMTTDAPVLAFQYYPAAFYDYDFANENGVTVLVPASPEKAHNYIWINDKRGGMKTGDDAYFLVVSNWHSDPVTDCGPYFNHNEGPETFKITRSATAVRYGLMYRLREIRAILTLRNAND